MQQEKIETGAPRIDMQTDTRKEGSATAQRLPQAISFMLFDAHPRPEPGLDPDERRPFRVAFGDDIQRQRLRYVDDRIVITAFGVWGSLIG